MDIEDLLDKGQIREDGDFNRGKVVTRRHKRRVPNGAAASQIEADSSFARGQKIYVRTWGCTHNTSDSEYMAGQLAEAGYDVKLDDSKRLECDLWLLNSCTVKAPAEDHFKNAINAAQKVNIPVVVAGCVPQGAPSDKFVKGLSTIGVQQIDRVVEVVEETLKGNTVKLLGPKKRAGKRIGGADLGLPKVRRNALIEIISVNTGCLNSCTYCKTKHARGDLASYPVDEIVARFEQAFEQGIVEVWLTSEDTGAYGRDIGTNIVELLNAVVKTIPEGCMMRIGMTNPPYILEHLDGIAKILNHPRVYSFLHVPVQSGSDAVLNSMRREYNREDFCKVVDTLRANVPDCNIATDIIAGFPTETEEDFDETISLCDKYKFPSLFMNQFFPRPGTPAAKWEQIPRQVIKERTKKLSNVFKSYLPFEGREGERHSVLITEMAHDKVSLVGHTKSYHQILVKGNPDELMGKRVDVVVEQTTKHSMLGRVVSEPKSVAIAANLQILNEKKRAKSWAAKKLEFLSEKLDLKIVGAIACASFIYFAISRTRSSL